jgi:hypothetical protein
MSATLLWKEDGTISLEILSSFPLVFTIPGNHSDPGFDIKFRSHLLRYLTEQRVPHGVFSPSNSAHSVLGYQIILMHSGFRIFVPSFFGKHPVIIFRHISFCHFIRKNRRIRDPYSSTEKNREEWNVYENFCLGSLITTAAGIVKF